MQALDNQKASRCTLANRPAALGGHPNRLLTSHRFLGGVSRVRYDFLPRQTVADVVPRDSQEPRRGGDVIMSLLESVLDQAIDGLFKGETTLAQENEALIEPIAIVRDAQSRGRAVGCRKMLKFELTRLFKDKRPLQFVGKLANVPRP